MQYRTLALAFAASAYAQTDLAGVVSVLVTALPSSLISEYETNSAAVASEISSAFEAGNTPSWFEALPTAVQTYLIPAVDSNSTTTASSVSGAPTVVINTSGNSTLATTRRTPSITSTSTGSGSETTNSSSGDLNASGSDSSSGSSTGGASMPTAIVGMGLAGAAGLVGLLAL